MKRQAITICFLILFVCGCSTATRSLPSDSKARVSFRGETQAGEEEHQLEVRRLAFYDAKQKKTAVSQDQYVVYNAGSYGPKILGNITGSAVLLRKTTNEIVEIYYVSGAHSHVRERWKLIGHTAELIEKDGIEWNQRPK